MEGGEKDTRGRERNFHFGCLMAQMSFAIHDVKPYEKVPIVD
jgi:hypothetical protein